jgi:FkbM family methyltransferase
VAKVASSERNTLAHKIRKVLSIIRTTSNFWDALLIRGSGTTKTIRFRNGIKLDVNYTQYDILRAWFEHLNKNDFAIKRLEDAWAIKDASDASLIDFKSTNILGAKLFFDLLESLTPLGWTIKRKDSQYLIRNVNSSGYIEKVDPNTYHLMSSEMELIGPLDALKVYFNELFDVSAYGTDFHGKTVLDIGGFCGETGVYFALRGAKKVIIYEPVTEHHKFIENNLLLNHVTAELHNEGVGEADGTINVSFEELGTSFGFVKGTQNMTIRIRNVSDVIRESKADIAKFDCEGAEMSLTKVPKEVLGLIPYYMVETHTEEIEKAVTEKFLESGFRVARESVPFIKGVSVLYFEKYS